MTWIPVSSGLPLRNGIYQVMDEKRSTFTFLNFVDGIWKGQAPISHITINGVGFWKQLPPDPRMPSPNSP